MPRICFRRNSRSTNKVSMKSSLTMYGQYSFFISGKTVGHRIGSSDTTSSKFPRPDQSTYFAQVSPLRDVKGSVAMNHGCMRRPCIAEGIQKTTRIVGCGLSTATFTLVVRCASAPYVSTQVACEGPARFAEPCPYPAHTKCSARTGAHVRLQRPAIVYPRPNR